MNRTRSIRPVKINSINMETSNVDGLSVSNNLHEVLESLLNTRKAVIDKLANIDSHIELVKHKLNQGSSIVSPASIIGKNSDHRPKRKCSICRRDTIDRQQAVVESAVIDRLHDDEIVPPGMIAGSNLANKRLVQLALNSPNKVGSWRQFEMEVESGRNMEDKGIQVSDFGLLVVKRSEAQTSQESHTFKNVIALRSPKRLQTHHGTFKDSPLIKRGLSSEIAKESIQAPKSLFNIEPEHIVAPKKVMDRVQNQIMTLKRPKILKNNKLKTDSPHQRKLLRRIVNNSEKQKADSINNSKQIRATSVTKEIILNARQFTARPRSLTRDKSFRLESRPKSYFNRTIYTKM
jgi:hypothetical protein